MQTDTICLGLLTTGPKSGYEIKQQLSGPLNQLFNLSYGSIYPTLGKLLVEKYVTCKQHSQEKKPDKKVYTITKKGISYFKHNLLEDGNSYIRSGNYGDQVKSEFLMLILFSKFIPKEMTDLMINERLLFTKQVYQLINYEGPLSNEGDTKLRATPSGIFIRGLVSEIINAGIKYLEKNRNKLGK
jgi:PadR family transcriptional regulator, regulatory protein AphA